MDFAAVTNAKMKDDVLTGDQAKLALRVLSGPNAGAETCLGEGTWLVGCNETDDLTFGDPELVGSHIRIAIGAGRLQVTALAPGVLIGGRQCPTNSPKIVDPLTPVRVGRTIFSLGPVGCSFPDVHSVVELEGVDAKYFPSAPPEPLCLGAGRIRLTTRLVLSPTRVGAMVCGVLIIICGAWVGTERLRPFTLTALPGTEPRKAARDILPTLSVAPDANVTVPDDKIISGGLRSGENTNLEVALRGPEMAADVASKRPTATTLSDAKLVDLAATVLHAFNIEAHVRVEGGGEISITGYGRSGKDVDAARRRLQQDIPGAPKINDAVATPDRARAFLEGAASAELRGSILITTNDEVVKVSGALSSAGYNEWQNLSARFKEKFAPHIRLESQCKLVTLPTVRGVHLGRTRFIVLENGRRQNVGDSIDQLGKIVAIDRDGLVLRISASDVRFLYSNEPEWIAEDANSDGR
ncbi:FHA domain-containing protein [Bradyrhizobium sp. CB3481]|uniref:FHA domain-containing protein n=1 Tax=Bradyrhizobium sp. CB3481 TaxID=3039158 RepID=UPI0024B223F1|nr:FHA domain-containing protein [Bradyrhizobium sp. CB3481]WFU14881.1 FHA domain-containing protein [Bradyrhizobium sp. CB3481]